MKRKSENNKNHTVSVKAKKQKPPLTRKDKMIKILIAVLIAMLSLWVLVGAALLALKSATYTADWDEIREFDAGVGYHMQEIGDDTFAFIPDEPKVGLIFYSGGLVENCSYIPLMRALAAEGVLCVVPKMPLNLAILDVNAASDGIKENFPEINSWYIGGHSLGGSMAAQHLKNNSEEFVGLILLASYSAVDISATELPVISVYGNSDGVLNMRKYEKNKKNLPYDNFTEYVIDGANHSGFGAYGAQKGDGEATVGKAEQIRITVEQIKSFIYK